MTTAPATDAAAKKSLTKLQRAIVDGLEDVKAVDIRVFDTEHLSPLFERVIVASGNTNRQTKALAASVRDAVRDAGFAKPRSEGEDNGEWIIIDCGAAVCHIMQPAIRQYYRLEEIWGEKPVRMKLGAAKPRTAVTSPDAAPAPARKTPAHKAPARKAAATATSKNPARKTAVAKKAAASGKSTAAKKLPAKKAAPLKTVVVNAPAAKKPATQRVAAKKTGKTAGK
ncbi:ribosome silencing factor [Comamonas flocculans]|uniref:Ribosomal silencing factor RsfS n=1 Tax=Comamonas flocculans TaxID=2597701 RepID=A0A5B8RWA3_9BURK|nr:ribosome silencing factor [Comamonas flocculans]QEA12077.1 ribosome silencing factor [Comamonas flocculans]